MRSARLLFRSRLGRLLLLGAFLIAAHGALPSPLLVARVLHIQKERFPCDGHACGCWSAEQCWETCCCFTPRERVAWAQRERVAIPDHARGVLRFAVRVPSGDAQPSSTGRSTGHSSHGSCPLCGTGQPAAPVRPAPTLGPIGCHGMLAWMSLGAPPAVVGRSVVTPRALPSGSVEPVRLFVSSRTPPIDPPPPRA